MVLGNLNEDLRVHLCLRHAHPHHHRLLWAHDPAAQECPNAVGLPGKHKSFFSLHI